MQCLVTGGSAWQKPLVGRRQSMSDPQIVHQPFESVRCTCRPEDFIDLLIGTSNLSTNLCRVSSTQSGKAFDEVKAISEWDICVEAVQQVVSFGQVHGCIRDHLAVLHLMFGQRTGICAVIKGPPLMLPQVRINRDAFPQDPTKLFGSGTSLVPKAIFIDNGQMDRIENQ